MVRVVWSGRSLGKLQDIIAYVRKDDLGAAVHLAGKLRDAGESLAAFPDRGRRRGSCRGLVRKPSVIRYLMRRDPVLIVDIHHTAQRR